MHHITIVIVKPVSESDGTDVKRSKIKSSGAKVMRLHDADIKMCQTFE